MTKRLKTFFYLSLGLSLLFTIRLTYLQVIAGPRYHRFSNFQSIRRQYLKAPRGRIFDRRGRIVADVKPSFSLSIIPREVDSIALRELQHLLPIDFNSISGNNSWTPVEIISNLPKEKVLTIEERLISRRGISLDVKPLRYYPYPILSHPLGFLNKITREELERDTTYRIDDFLGKQGIEKEYEKCLKGKDGMRLVEVDARGREIGNLPEVKEIRPIAGCDLYLSLDLDLFLLCESLFANYKKGCCIALNPNDGRVVLLYSKPHFDPNLFLFPLLKEKWEVVKNNPLKPFFNRATQAQFPPGSTFKPLVALAGMKKGVLDKNRRFQPCAGSYKFGNRYFRCWTSHGSLNLVDAIAQSCNTYFYQAGLATGLEAIVQMAQEFPFGKKTGIDLPEESGGNLPTPEYLQKKFSGKYPKGIVLNLSIGQGEILVTPLQLVLFYCAIARSGEIYQPHLVDSIKFPSRIYHPPFLDSLPNFRPVPNGNDTTYIYYPQKRQISLPQEYLRVIEDGLYFGVERGTGQAAFIPEITICGKTGTAQNPAGPDHAWFCGYGPKGNPTLVVLVLIENVGAGGTYAAPIAQRIFRRYFNLD